MAVVYEHLRKDTNEVFYVGIGKEEKRAFEKSPNRRSPHWYRIVKKYGYTVNVKVNDCSWDEAKEIEKYLIAFYGRKDLGLGSLVNMTDGGDGIIRCIVSEETRQKLSEAQIGNKNHNFGKTASQETRKKMSKAQKGRTHLEETKKKISLSKINKEGVKGYSFDKKSNKYKVRISIGGKRIHIGRFNTPSEAEEAYKNARIKYFA